MALDHIRHRQANLQRKNQISLERLKQVEAANQEKKNKDTLDRYLTQEARSARKSKEWRESENARI